MSNYNVNSDGKFPIKMWTRGVPVEDKAIAQLVNLSNMPFIHKHVAAMPDVHLGMGATVGSVIATDGAIIPAAIGVDIGCGINAVQLDLKASDLPDNLAAVRSAIEKAVPHGRTDNGGVNDRGAFYNPKHTITSELEYRLAQIVGKTPSLEKPSKRIHHHLGTLGSGNHFIEICLDLNQNVWLMLHSGSRGIGNAIGRIFIDLAKKDMERWFINLPDKDLAYLPEGSEHFDNYIEAMTWAQDYAMSNRNEMMGASLAAFELVLGRQLAVVNEAINCHHNFTTKERHFGKNVWITRKGAVRARKDDLGIIPGSMGARSFIIKGKGNPDSFCSCSHGAGRVMSRTEAARTFTIDDHIHDTQGVECRKDISVIDETPRAYKNIEDVMAAQSDLVEVVAELKQILCVKG